MAALTSVAALPRDPLEEFLALAPAAIARTRGAEHRIEFVNPVFQRLLNGRAVLGKRVRDAFPELEGQAVLALYDKVYASGQPFVAEAYPVRWDRQNTGTLETSYFNVSLQPVRGEGGRVEGVISLSMEVTGMVEARQRAEAAEQRFRDLVHGLPDAIVWEADAATVDFLYVSPSAEQLLGYPVSAWYEEKPNFWVNHLHPEDRDRSVRFCKNETAQGRDHEFEYRLIAKDGRIVWIRDRAYCVRDESGQITKLRGLMIDITKAKMQEAEIRRFNDTLETKVRERTGQLHETLRELESFSYSVSHDLRAPIRHIGSFAELLDRQSGAALDEKGRYYLGTIRESATRAGKLVDDLLAFSRMGRTDLAPDHVDLQKIVRDVLQELSPDIDPKIRFSIGSLPVCKGDASMLRIVVRNLLSNAVKFTRRQAAPTIEVAARIEPNGDRVVSVRDNGVGFDMTHSDKLFGVFERLHSAEEFEGNGIGLATVRRIVSRHGGRTWAEGQPGCGATFFFSLPGEG